MLVIKTREQKLKKTKKEKADSKTDFNDMVEKCLEIDEVTSIAGSSKGVIRNDVMLSGASTTEINSETLNAPDEEQNEQHTSNNADNFMNQNGNVGVKFETNCSSNMTSYNTEGVYPNQGNQLITVSCSSCALVYEELKP